MTDSLVTVTNKLAKTSGSSLDDFLAPSRQSMLLVDVSGSMSDYIVEAGARKIDELRKVVTQLRETHPVPVVAFGLSRRQVGFVDSIPEPSGGTPLALAIDFAKQNGATHLVVISDGIPDSTEAAMNSARAFGGPIDVFYVGPRNAFGARFLEQLANATGGSCQVTNLTETKALTGKIVALLGDGSDAAPAPKSVIQL